MFRLSRFPLREGSDFAHKLVCWYGSPSSSSMPIEEAASTLGSGVRIRLRLIADCCRLEASLYPGSFQLRAGDRTLSVR